MRINLTRLISLSLVALSSLTTLTITTAQSPVVQPSSDLIFSAVPDQGTPTLMRLTSAGKLMSFYADIGVEPSFRGLRPLKWSPQGDLLAVVRLLSHPATTPVNELPLQICLVTREGVLTTCFQDLPSAAPAGQAGHQDQLSTPDWSASGRYFHFVTVDTKVPGTLRLVEADAHTGRTLRILYEHSNAGEPIIIWTRDLHYVAVGVGNLETNVYPYSPVTLINLQTKAQLDVNTLVPKNAVERIVCPNFSRSGSYMTLVANVGSFDSTQDQLLVFDKQGKVQFTLGPNTIYGHLTINCPTWRNNEDTLYFVAHSDQDQTAAIFKYLLIEQQLSVVYRLPADIASDDSSTANRVYSPVELSTDEKQIAFETSDNPNPGDFYSVKIADESGNSKQILDPFPTTMFPLWVPPAPTTNSLKSSVAECKISDTTLMKSLNAKIDAGQWDAFINEVNAQTGKKIDQTCADGLIAAATYLSGNSPGAKP